MPEENNQNWAKDVLSPQQKHHHSIWLEGREGLVTNGMGSQDGVLEFTAGPFWGNFPDFGQAAHVHCQSSLYRDRWISRPRLAYWEAAHGCLFSVLK